MDTRTFHKSEELPWILFLRHGSFFTTAAYLQRGLERICNLVPIYYDESSLFYYAGTHYLGGIAKKLGDYLLRRHLRTAIPQKSFDAIIVVDPVRLSFDFGDLGIPTAYYAIESHISLEEHITRADVPRYDYVFLTQKDYIETYRKRGCKRLVWLPHAGDPDYHHPYPVEESYDLCFIGQFGRGGWIFRDRDNFINSVKSSMSDKSLFIGNKYLHDMSLWFAKSKVVLNKSIRGYFTQRVFEALACRRPLLTDLVGNGFPELFQDRKHLAVYRDIGELKELAEYYLSDLTARRQIAEEGYSEVLAKHTYVHRARTLLSSMGLL